MKELKLCPFCGRHPYTTDGGQIVSCMGEADGGKSCPIAGIDFSVEEWEQREKGVMEEE